MSIPQTEADQRENLLHHFKTKNSAMMMIGYFSWVEASIYPKTQSNPEEAKYPRWRVGFRNVSETDRVCALFSQRDDHYMRALSDGEYRDRSSLSTSGIVWYGTRKRNIINNKGEIDRLLRIIFFYD